MNRGDEAGEVGDYLPLIYLGSNFLIKIMTAAEKKKCVVNLEGDMKCFGENENGQLGYGDTNDRGDNLNEMGNYLPLVNIGSGMKVEDANGMNEFTCALLTNSKDLKCFGLNTFGQLGYGDTTNRGGLPNQLGDYLAIINLGTSMGVISFNVGIDHTCIIFEDSSMKCFGNNDFGQLGYGDTAERGDQSNEVGEYLPYIETGTNVIATKVCLGNKFTVSLFCYLS